MVLNIFKQLQKCSQFDPYVLCAIISRLAEKFFLVLGEVLGIIL